MAVLIFALLWSVRKCIAVPGRLFALYCVFNGLERFFIEKIRVNVELDVLGMAVTQAEVISTLTFIAGLLLWAVLGRKKGG
jgi:prolipoprotein diacylglyceryltransferase